MKKIEKEDEIVGIFREDSRPNLIEYLLELTSFEHLPPSVKIQP